MIDCAKTETKMFDTEYLNSSKENQWFWHRYNKLTGNKTISIVEPLFRHTNNDEYAFDDAEISNTLREVHIDKKDTHSDFDDTHREKIGKDTVDLFMTENGQNTFSEVSEKEITVVIRKLKNFSSPGSDRIGSLIIKHGGKNLHNLIKLVLNATFQLGYFPNAWKFDNRIYLNKSGKESYHGPKSYRSISLTNTLGKILERIFLS